MHSEMMHGDVSKTPRKKELIEKFQIVEKNLHELSKLFLPASVATSSITTTPLAPPSEKMLAYENNFKEVIQTVNSLKIEQKEYGEFFNRFEEKLAKHQEIIDKLVGVIPAPI